MQNKPHKEVVVLWCLLETINYSSWVLCVFYGRGHPSRADTWRGESRGFIWILQGETRQASIRLCTNPESMGEKRLRGPLSRLSRTDKDKQGIVLLGWFPKFPRFFGGPSLLAKALWRHIWQDMLLWNAQVNHIRFSSSTLFCCSSGVSLVLLICMGSGSPGWFLRGETEQLLIVSMTVIHLTFSYFSFFYPIVQTNSKGN